MAYLLTIAIPTYNRSKFLRRLLELLASEVKGLENEVELLVSDNASTDETQAVCKEMTGRLPLRYHRQERNVGFDHNALWIVENAQGEYLWMFGDDDLMVEGSIGRMLAFLKEQKTSVASQPNASSPAGLKEPLSCVLANYVNVEGKPIMPVGDGQPELHGPGELKETPRLIDALAVTGSIGGAVYRTATVQKIAREKVERQADGSLMVVTPSGRRIAFRHYSQMFYAIECALAGPKFALYRQPCMRAIWDGGYYDAKVVMLSNERSLQAMQDFADYFPWIYSTPGLGLGSSPYRIMQFFIYIDPAFDRETHRRIYANADDFIAFYKKHHNRWWRLFWLMRQFHSRFPLGERIFWTSYVLFNKLRGRGTFADINKKRVGTDARATSW